MTTPLLCERDLSFLLYEFLDTEALLERPRYREHSREVFTATLATARAVAERHFCNHFAKGDANEPVLRDGKVQLIPEVAASYRAVAEAGFLGAPLDAEDGGLQLPEVLIHAAFAYMSSANVASAGMPLLTLEAARTIARFGSPAQRALYVPAMCDGRFGGTMALTEPAQGSSLGDIRTRALPQADGSYRLFGRKMFISAGDHEITGNIVHLVLARIEDAPPGAKGISLFICPKFLVNADGSPGARNDVALAGLMHKMGYRSSLTTALNFGEREGAVAWLVGEPNQGLAYMFQMMNEARIWVGLNAAAVACRGFQYSLAYARYRTQGRLPSSRDVQAPQVTLVEHADVRRMLLAQKAYAEGALALALYASSLFEDQHTAPTERERQRAGLLLDLLTPVVKSWPAKYGARANDLAIQVLGGCGYMRDYPVEQLYRDSRIHAIYEGAEGIHGLDLLGRKVMQPAAFTLFQERVVESLHEAEVYDATRDYIHPLRQALRDLDAATQRLRQAVAENPDLGLANATLYLDCFGRITLAWIWLRQAIAAARALERGGLPAAEQDFYRGKLQAARYFLRWELPETKVQAELLQQVDATCFGMEDAWF
jgi:butyryl-CoA dehydrogenase